MLIFFGCGKKEGSGKMITGKGEYKAEYDTRNLSVELETEEKAISIEFMGEEYEMEYVGTREPHTSPYIVNEYRDDEWNCMDITKDTGEVTFFMSDLFSNKEKRDLTLPILSEDELRKLADDYAKDVIDIEEYQVDVEVDTEHSRYEYVYTRYIDGYETSDRFRIGLSDRGEVILYSDSLMRDMKYVSLEGFDKEKAYEAVKEVVKEQLPKACLDTIELQSETLILTAENEVAFHYFVGVTIEDVGKYSDAIHVRVIL